MRHERLNPLGGFFTINWARQRRQNHKTGHGQLADLFAKIRQKVPSGLAFLAFHGGCNQFCSTHLLPEQQHCCGS